MKNCIPALLALVLAVTPALSSAAEAISPGSNDTVRTMLSKYNGKTVTVRLKDGGELTGKVRSVGNFLVHLGALQGKEFFDATVDLNDVAALIVRTRDR